MMLKYFCLSPMMLKYFFCLSLIMPFTIWLLIEVGDLARFFIYYLEKREKEYLLIFFILFLIGIFLIYK